MRKLMKICATIIMLSCILACILVFVNAAIMDTNPVETTSIDMEMDMMSRIIDPICLSNDDTTSSEEVVPDTEEVIEDEVVEEDPQYIEYRVSAGDSFWSIANTYYGDGSKYAYIMAMNDITMIHPGDIIKIYDPEDYEVDDSVVEEYEEVSAMIAESTPTTISYTEPVSVSGSSDGTKPDWTTYKDTTVYDTSNMTYVGEYKITGYDPHCKHCCGKTDGYTAAGTQAILGYSAGSNSLPLGTVVYIEGYGIFRIDDCGGSSKNLIDIACDSHDICYQMTGRANVYIVK